MKRLFVLSLLLFLTVPCAQGQEPHLLHRFDLTVSGIGGVKHNAPGVLDTDVHPYTGLSATLISYIASRESRRHPGIENRHRLGVAFSMYNHSDYADMGAQLGVKYLIPQPAGSSVYLMSLHGMEFRETEPASDGEECTDSDPCRAFVSTLELGRAFPNTTRHAFNLAVGANYRWRSDIETDYYFGFGWVWRFW